MEKRNLIALISGSITAILWMLLSIPIRTTELIWFQTRIFGLMSFIGLFLTVLLGELRLLYKIKAQFQLFKYHTPLAIFSLFLVAIHFVSAILDEYKWGKGLAFVNFLGFVFSDKWLVYLSLGTLAFYLMLLVALTSSRKSIQFIGFKKWKLVHYLSYISLVLAYIHSANLGTDLKSSYIAPLLGPLFLIMFLLATVLMLTRIIKGSFDSLDQLEIVLIAVFLITLIIGGVFFASYILKKNEQLTKLENDAGLIKESIDVQTKEIYSLTQDSKLLKDKIEVIKNATGS